MQLRDELDLNQFWIKFKIFLEFINQFEEFSHYFKTFYANQYQLWAYCFRKHLKLNTNMAVENYHFILKDSYFSRKKSFRIDKCIHLILLHLNDRLDRRNHEIDGGKKTKRSTESFKNHKLSLKLFDDYEFVVDGSFIIVRSKQNESNEEINENLVVIQDCISHDCKLKCVWCLNKCICSVFCDCKENSIEYHFCVHSHLALQYLKRSNDLKGEINYEGEDEDLSTEDENETNEEIYDNDDYVFEYEVVEEDKNHNNEERGESEMKMILLNKFVAIKDEFDKDEFKINEFKFRIVNRSLNDLSTAIKQDVDQDLMDFIKSPSKKIKMINQKRF